MLQIHDIDLISAVRNKPFNIYPTQYRRLKRGIKFQTHSGLFLKVLKVYPTDLRTQVLNRIIVRLRLHYGIRFKLPTTYNQVKVQYIDNEYTDRESRKPLTNNYFK